MSEHHSNGSVEHRSAKAEGQRQFLRLADVKAAFALLTAVPLRRPAETSETFGRATLFFPAVGLLLGAVLAGVEHCTAPWLAHWARTVVVLACWEGLTGLEPLRAVARLGPSRRAGGGLAAGVLVAKSIALWFSQRPDALLFTPMLARWSVVVLAVGARACGAPGRKFNSAISFHEFAWTSVFTFAVLFSVAEAFGIVVVIAAAALTLGWRLSLHRWVGGVSWTWLQASIPVIEIVVLTIFALD